MQEEEDADASSSYLARARALVAEHDAHHDAHHGGHVDHTWTNQREADEALYQTDTYWYNEVTGETATEDPTTASKGYHDEAKDRTYWVDPMTNLTTWEKPAAYAWREVPSEEDPAVMFYWNDATGESTWEKPAQLGWRTQEVGFWYNTVTGQSTGKPPPEVGHFDAASNRTFWIDPETGKATWIKPAPWDWKEVPSTDPAHDGRSYFVNERTKETQWERPVALGWSRKSKTKIFYFNRLTGESTYERPKAMGYEDPETGRMYYDVLDPETGRATGEVTWDPPADAAHAWSEQPAPEDHPSAGKTYYHNRVTGATQWTAPEETGWIKYHEDL